MTSNKILDGTIVGADLAANISIFTSGDMQSFNFTANSGNFNNLTAGNLVFTSGTITGNFTVLGATQLNTLTTTSSATLNSLGVTNNATVGGTLGVTGATTLGQHAGRDRRDYPGQHWA
ncbi:MAG: hypothetical protein IPK62_17365 [Bacteroidetes bacterium]|nr:hypothetical protein [Bacteroidota bacterium]